MPRLFAVNGKYFSKAAELTILLAAAMTLMFVGRSQAQGPALTTISEARYSDEGWGDGYNGNLVGRFTHSSFTLTRYARAQTYFLRSYDGGEPPKYSRYSTALHVDYPINS